MKTLALIAIIILICFNSSCKDDSNELSVLPTATQSGENTFGCFLDGENFIPDVGPLNLLDNVSALYDEPGNDNEDLFFLSIVANDQRTIGEDSIRSSTFVINVMPIDGVGEVKDFSQLLQANIYYVSQLLEIPGTIERYVLDTQFDYNFLEITNLDTEANICSGGFHFRLINEITSELMLITGGRFDVVYQPY